MHKKYLECRQLLRVETRVFIKYKRFCCGTYDLLI